MGVVHELPEKFTGKGEVKGFVFKRVGGNDYAYVYEVDTKNGGKHYEVFERKTVPVCIDFKKRIYSETEFKEVYPKSKDFGTWAYCCQDIRTAFERAKEFDKNQSI